MARRGTPSLGAVASSPRGAADGWRDRVDARAAAEMPSGYEVYDRCLPFKEVPTRTRHLQVHLFENRPNFPRERILGEVWDIPYDPGTNVLDVHIGRLRKKLDHTGPPLIRTVRGNGYALQSG